MTCDCMCIKVRTGGSVLRVYYARTQTMSSSKNKYTGDWIKSPWADCWLLGPEWVLEKTSVEITHSPDSDDELESWTVGGSTYELFDQDDENEFNLCKNVCEPFHAQMNGTGCWNIGESMICKIMKWSEGMLTEAEIIGFVHKNIKEVPLPRIFAYWTDTTLGLSFMLMERAIGKPLSEVWHKYNDEEKSAIIDDLGNIYSALAKVESPYFESIDHKGVFGAVPALDAPELTKDDKPRYPRHDCASYDRAIEKKWGSNPCPTLAMCLQHGDLHPGNIIAPDPSTNPGRPIRITAIIDWEAAHYAPFWTFPLLLYNLDSFLIEDVKGKAHFRDRMVAELIRRHYEKIYLSRFRSRR